MNIPEQAQNTMDHVAAVGVLAVFAEWVHVAVAVLAGVWYILRIYDWIRGKMK